MKSWTNLFVLVALFLAASIPAFADIANPNTNKLQTQSSKLKTPMNIRLDGGEKEAKLLISRDVLRELSAELEGGDSQNAAHLGRFSNPSGTQTLMAGIFLSMAFAFGGVWLVHSRKQPNKLTRVALGVMILSLCGAGTSLVYANAGPPPVARSLTSKILIPEAMSYGVWGEVKVEIVESGNGITLVLPKK
jgi:hypothetical protein